MDAGRATSPEKVAAEIADTLVSDTQRLRHPVAHMAGMFMFLRKILPDGIFLKAVGKNYKTC